MRIALVAVYMVFVLLVPISAQDQGNDDEAPLVFFGRGLFIMDEGSEEPQEWPDCGDGYYRVRLSPTGEWLAVMEAQETIRICNLVTEEIIDLTVPGTNRTPQAAALPSWSPDGQQIAWSVTYEGGDHWLVVYDLAENESRILVDDLASVDQIRPQVLWGQSGILVVVDDQDPERRVAPLFSETGILLADDLSFRRPFASYFWITDQDGKEYLARYQNVVQGDIIDPLTGSVYFAEGIELYSPLAPDGLAVENVIDARSGYTRINLPDGDTVVIDDLWGKDGGFEFVPQFLFDPRYIAIAPDGQAFAVFYTARFIWRDGELTEVPDTIPHGDTTGVLWGPLAYRIRGEVITPAG